MRKTALILLLLVTVCAFGQNENPVKTTEKPFIEVTGTALKEVVPDKITISISLTDKVVNNEKYSIEKQEKNLIKALEKINIDLEKLYLSDATSEITTYKKKETGFKVTKQYTLTVKNAKEVSDVFKALYEINIREAFVSGTESTAIETIRKEVRIAAIKAAKDKADYLLTAIGEQVDKPIEIREETDTPFRGFAANVAFSVNDAAIETNYRMIVVKFSYYIKYGIK